VGLLSLTFRRSQALGLPARLPAAEAALALMVAYSCLARRAEASCCRSKCFTCACACCGVGLWVGEPACVHACTRRKRACVCACVRARVCACVQACVRARITCMRVRARACTTACMRARACAHKCGVHMHTLSPPPPHSPSWAGTPSQTPCAPPGTWAAPAGPP